MRRSIIYLLSGIFCGVLLTSIISVYLFHDVDQDQIGHLNAAFASLCAEGALFGLVVGNATWLLTSLGNKLFGLKESSDRGQLSFFLGVGVTVLQYGWDLAARRILPRFADVSLSIYMIVAVVLCTVVLLWGSSRKNPPREASEA